MSRIETVNVNVKTEGIDEAAKQFETLATGVKKAADSADNLDAKFEDVFEGIEPLTTRLGEAEDRLYELALAGDTTSKEYQELLTKVGEYRKVQIQTDLAVDGAATTLSQKLGSALTGVTSGFAATQGAIALFGSENKALEESLLKVQSALAIQQGVEGLRTSYKELGGATGIATKAQAAFNFVMNLNPIILISSLIAGAVVALSTFTDVLDPIIDKVKQFTDFLGITSFEEERVAKERAKRHDQQVKAQQEEIALLKQKRQLEQEDFERNIAFLESQGQSTLRLRRARILDQISEKERISELLKGTFVEKKAQRDLIELKTQLNNINREIRAENKAAADERAEQDRKAIEDAKKINEERRNQIDLDNQILKEGLDFANQLRQDAADKEAKIQEANFANIAEQARAHRETQEREIERNKEFRVQAAFDTLDLITNITELFAKKGEKQARKAFKVQQAAQIATTLGTTYLSATQAYASQFLPVPDPSSPIRGSIAAGFAVAAGLANVAKIASQKFDGGGSTGSPSLSGSIPDSGTQSPQFNVVGDSGLNQLAQLQQEPVQAFVVSGEVTTAQALDRNRVQNATL
mgnify:CR=1 FL=1